MELSSRRPCWTSCRQRAAGYDRDNRFCQEDFDELKAAGYLKMAVPKEFGGHGFTLAEVARETRRLAGYAPATALCINMHNYWVGDAADLLARRRQVVRMDPSRTRPREKCSRPGMPRAATRTSILMSITKAEKVPGGYRFTGRKSFGSLSPGVDEARPARHGHERPGEPEGRPRISDARQRRFTIKETWDTLGMRATRSDDTVLEGATIPDKYIARIVPAGFTGADNFVLGIFAWALINFGNVYYGLAQRVLELTRRAREVQGIARPDALDGVPPARAASGRRDGDGARGDRRAARDRRARLVDGRGSWDGVANQDRGRQMPRGRRRLEGRGHRARCVGRIRDVQEERDSNACSATPAPAASIRPTPRSRAKSLARWRWGSTRTRCRAGARR